MGDKVLQNAGTLEEAEDLITIDPDAGISEEEQREILAGINNITAKNRLSLVGAAQKTKTAGPGFTAKKKGSFFPVLVNITALLLLAGGFFLLSSFQVQEEVKIRAGERIHNIAEQALIEEIRRETASQLTAKENEITLMTGKLAGIDSELQQLQDSVEAMIHEKEAELRRAMSGAFEEERQRLVEQNLSEAAIAERMRRFDAERIAMMNVELADYRRRLDEERAGSEDALKSLQEEYRSNLSDLQNERSRLLEDSRAREAALRAQLEASTRELADVSERSRAALSSARSELDRLSGDQEKAAVIESQLGAYYAAVNDQIRTGLLDGALDTLALMREYLDTPAFQTIRPIQVRKTLYTASIDILGKLIDDAKASRDAASAPAQVDADVEQIITDLWRKNVELEDELAALNSEAAAAGVRVLEMERQVAGQESAAAELQRRNDALNRTVAAHEDAIAGLQGRNDALNQTVAAHEDAIAGLQGRNDALNQTVAERDTMIEDLRTQNTAQGETIQILNNTLRAIQELTQ
jgi:chromosome segregation ATPase